MELNFIPRKSQEEILAYTGGTLGISAVPGSGKTQVLSALAAKLLFEGYVKPEEEILIVTLVNSAVDNFSARIEKFVKNNGLFPNMGYRVRTLHGLAFDILREDPSIVGLDTSIAVIDEKDATATREKIVRAWIQQNPDAVDLLLKDEISSNRKQELIGKDLPITLEKFLLAFIRTAKDKHYSAEQILLKVDEQSGLLYQAGAEMFLAYHQTLSARGLVDFDDLIALSYQALLHSPELVARMREKFAYILEDEAQDSSQTQENILRTISRGNWVRVGDPNQAIYETFTTASPEYLIDFIEQADMSVDLPETGRCQPSIMRLANELIEWTINSHPLETCRDALRQPYLSPTAPKDPQQNPANNPDRVVLYDKKMSSEEELDIVARAAGAYVKENPDKTIAILSSTNRRGVDMISVLRGKGIPFVENLNSSSETRSVIDQVKIVLTFLAAPTSIQKARKALNVLVEHIVDQENKDLRAELLELIEQFQEPEMILDIESDLLSDQEPKEIDKAMLAIIDEVKIWSKGTLLPVDQLILLIGQSLFREPTQIALIHKLAYHIRQGNMLSENWGMDESIKELGVIAENQKRFIGFSSADSNFDPDLYKGKVLVSTIHKAKGLEWDKVILLSVNNYDFPGYQENDSYLSEKWFLHDNINIEAEGIHSLLSVFEGDGQNMAGEEPQMTATEKARLDLVKERLRVLFVAITRAKEELAMTWNTGRRNDQTPAIAFTALSERKKEW